MLDSDEQPMIACLKFKSDKRSVVTEYVPCHWTTSQRVISDPKSTDEDSPRAVIEDQGPKQRARSPAVDVVGLHPFKKIPKGNSVKQYHNVSSMQGVVFYQALEVTDEYGTQHCFDIRDKTQGALVRFELLSTCGCQTV